MTMLDIDMGHAATRHDTEQFFLCNHALTHVITHDNVKLLLDYVHTYHLFLPHSDAVKASMQERLRYNDSRLQKGLYMLVDSYITVITILVLYKNNR